MPVLPHYIRLWRKSIPDIRHIPQIDRGITDHLEWKII
jgi:hypothetical protein